MAGVKYAFCSNDLRQQFKTFFPQTTLTSSSKFTAITATWPLDAILLLRDDAYQIHTSTIQPATTLVISLANNHYTFSLGLKTELTALYFPADFCFFAEEPNGFYKFSGQFNNYLSSDSVAFFVITAKPQLVSISSLFAGCSWVEREIKEFSLITFLGLRDTRRLLTDYTFLKEEEDYRTLSYDLTIQDVYFN
jgi:hypothetical protein